MIYTVYRHRLMTYRSRGTPSAGVHRGSELVRSAPDRGYLDSRLLSPPV